MSREDVERFVGDLKSNSDLLDEVREGAGGLQSVVDLAKDKGYDISLDEAKSYIQDKANAKLSDQQLDAVAGGKGHHSVATAAWEAAMAYTTGVQTAEAVTTVVEAADVATSAEVAAEVGIVIVLT